MDLPLEDKVISPREELNKEYTALATEYGDNMFKLQAINSRIEFIKKKFEELAHKEQNLADF